MLRGGEQSREWGLASGDMGISGESRGRLSTSSCSRKAMRWSSSHSLQSGGKKEGQNGGGQRVSRRHSKEAAQKGRSEGRAHLNEPMPPGRWCWDAHADAQQCGMASEGLVRAKLPDMQQGSLKRAHAQVGGDGVDGLRVLHALLSDVQSGQVQAKRADLRATRVKGRQ
jgi:hypothetical protein